MGLGTIDLTVFTVYILGMMAFGVWISVREKNADSSDYFLASRSLPWWAIGGSLIASNISTEQIMGMNGSGFELGLAIATYELMAAITLIIVAKYFLPIYLKQGIFTMPQFLEQRYSGTVRTIMSVFWVLLFVLVNITSVLYLGGLAIEQLLGVPLMLGIIGLVIYSATFSVMGGLKAVVWTDVIQVVVLLIGGTVAAMAVLAAVGDGSVLSGIGTLYERAPQRFEMLFEPGDTFVEKLTGERKSAYSLLPGLGLLFGGMWIANLYYWGNNQYIIQRALAAKDIREAQRGVAFAAFLKLFIPFFAVLPGIAAFVLDANIEKADQAFPWVLSNYVVVGLKGLTFAALVAAIGSSISSIVNSASTIFTLDIYKNLIKPNATEGHLVKVGQIAAVASLVIGIALAPQLENLGQVFQFIQEYTGYISPGVVAIFLFGMFWKRATAKAALAAIVISIPLSLGINLAFPDLPFLDRMAIVFLISSLLVIGVSLAERPTATAGHSDADRRLRWVLIVALIAIGGATGAKIFIDDIPGVAKWTGALVLGLAALATVLLLTEKKADDPRAIDIDTSLFRTGPAFNTSAFAIILILTAVYTLLA